MNSQKKIHIIVNPASGQGSLDLEIVNKIFHENNIKWDVSITNDKGDATKFARHAAETGANVVAVYGGDGTVMEVAEGLLDYDIPIAIFPGGTANVVSVELGIPADLEQACSLVCSDNQKAISVDIARLNDDVNFLLRAGMGFEAEMVEGADRELKNKFGSLAYALSGLSALQNSELIEYEINLDGKIVKSEGIGCMICNSASLGIGGLKLANDVRVDDGLIDVFIIKQLDIPSLVQVSTQIFSGTEPQPQSLEFFQTKNVRVKSSKEQSLQYDGEVLGLVDDVSVGVLPGRVKVIVSGE